MKKLWEIARLRDEMRIANEMAMEECRKQGVTLHPRIAEHRRKLEEQKNCADLGLKWSALP